MPLWESGEADLTSRYDHFERPAKQEFGYTFWKFAIRTKNVMPFHQFGDSNRPCTFRRLRRDQCCALQSDKTLFLKIFKCSRNLSTYALMRPLLPNECTLLQDLLNTKWHYNVTTNQIWSFDSEFFLKLRQFRSGLCHDQSFKVGARMLRIKASNLWNRPKRSIVTKLMVRAFVSWFKWQRSFTS